MAVALESFSHSIEEMQVIFGDAFARGTHAHIRIAHWDVPTPTYDLDEWSSSARQMRVEIQREIDGLYRNDDCYKVMATQFIVTHEGIGGSNTQG